MQKIILASGSPRRKVLMKCMGLDFDVIPSSYEEHLDDSQPAEIVATELAFGKAEDVASQHSNDYVIGSDLIIALNGKQLAKPKDAAEARQMLMLLSSGVHQAICAVVLVCKNKAIKKAKVVTVQVKMAQLPPDVIEKYIATGDPYDKAGGYSRQHPLIAPYLQMQGDEHAVTGLPTKELRELLVEQHIIVPNNDKTTRELFDRVSLAEQNVII